MYYKLSYARKANALTLHPRFNFLHTCMKGRKTGGRQKGTPNKTTKTIREKLSEVTSDYYNSDKFFQDLEQLEPRERVALMERLTNYVAPKMQSTTLDATVQARNTIEDRLLELSDNP